MASYDPAQFSPTGALIGERNFRGYCIPGVGGMEAAENGVGWFGLETAAFQVAPWPYHYSIAGHEMVAPEASTRPIETLPLFPIHAEQEAEEQALENSFYCGGMAGGLSQEDSVNGYHHFLGGRGGASLELTLNSYYYEHPSSM